MKIYGVALLALSYLIGKFVGGVLGKCLGVEADVGGVGFAMILLLFLYSWLKKKNLFPEESERGLAFWSSMYIPVVVAMASVLNVKAALEGGFTALVVGVLVTLSSFLFIPLIVKIGGNGTDR